MIRHHNVASQPCAGIGHLPLEQSDTWLREYAARINERFLAACDAVRKLEEQRANYIDPALIVRRGLLAGETIKLNRRVRRIETWVDRYTRSVARQMYLYGYAIADRPPEYLFERAGVVRELAA